MTDTIRPADDGDRRKWFVLASVCLGLGMLMIDTFVVNVALPSISRDFEADLALTQWVVSAYVLAVAVLPLSAGRLGDIFGGGGST
jgi:MFS family permease